jgi:segregation and condensation protein B
MEPELLKSIIEGLIFSHAEPVSVDTLVSTLRDTPPDDIRNVVEELAQEYERRARGFVLAKVAGGYQFRTLEQIAPWILEMKKVKPSRLSRAALEALTIIAYHQPVTRGKIEQIRGVESGPTIRSLIERDLVTVVGRKDIPGRPLLYGTSKRFLEVFGLPDLASLPPLPDAEAISDEPI